MRVFAISLVVLMMGLIKICLSYRFVSVDNGNAEYDNVDLTVAICDGNDKFEGDDVDFESLDSRSFW